MTTKQQLNDNLATELREEGYWVPMPGPQQLAVAISRERRFREILFGGARGPGKTDASIAVLSQRAPDPRAKQLVIRKNAEDLSDFEDRASQAFKCFGMKLRRHPMILSGKGTGRILGGHLKDDDAYTKYQGHEYCRINIEELTQIPSEKNYLKLISSARSKYRDLFPQIFNTTNPGGIGMAWVKKRFVSPDASLCDTIRHKYPWVDVNGKAQVTEWLEIIDKKTGMRRAYIPATIDSNPILMASDPDYVQQLEGLQDTDPELYRAWRHGDWDIQFGAVFQEFRRVIHVFSKLGDYGYNRKRFDESWKIMGMDWGYNDECVLLKATFDTITEKEERAFVYRELHDNHKTPDWWAEKIKEEQERDPVDILALPHDAFSHLGGTEPIADIIKKKLDELPPDLRPKIIKADKLTRELKKSAITMFHNLLAPASDGIPALLIHHSCNYLIDTLPTIVYAKDSGGEEIDSGCEDHALDSAFYTLLSANKVRGKLFNKSEKIVQKQQSFVAGTGVTRKELGIDTSTLVMNAAKKRGGDWRTM